MRLTWHIIWKDVRSERWMLLLWASLYAVQAALGFAISAWEVDSQLIDNLKVGNALLVGLQFAVGYVFTVQLVQADEIAGTRMFWVTRPISGARLFLAKAVTILLLIGLLPVLMLLPWWLHNGFTARDVAWSALELLGWQLLVIAPAFLIASLTDDLGRAILWGLVLLAAVIASVVVLRKNAANGIRLAVDVMNGEFSPYRGLLFTKLWLMGFLLVAVSLAVAMHQFSTRHLVRSGMLAVPLVALALVSGMSWPWDCSVLFAPPDRPAPVAAPASRALEGLELSVAVPEVRGVAEVQTKLPQRWIEQVVELRDVPADLAITYASIEQRWHGAGEYLHSARWFLVGWLEPSLRHALALSAYREDPETARWLEERFAERRAKGLPVSEAWKDTGDRTILVGETRMSELSIARIQSRSPDGEARVTIEFARPVVSMEMPLAPGARWSGRSVSYQVGEWIDRQDDGAVVQMLTAVPGLKRHGIWLVGGAESSRPRPRELSNHFVMVNRHEHSLGRTAGTGNTARTGKMVIGGVNLDWRPLRVYPTRLVRSGRWVAGDPDWVEHCSLALVDYQPVARIVREVKTGKANLRLAEPKEIPPPVEKSKAPAI